MSAPGIVILGAGHLGSFHAEKVVELAREGAADLLAVVEVDETRRRAASERFGVPAVVSLKDVPGEPAAAIIATPTATHEDLAREALGRGWHLLVEKPLGGDVATARRIVELGARADRLLQVGLVERFNPAVEAALRLAAPPCYVVTERLSPFTGRSTGDDVVMDLMIHDLDLIGAVIQSDLVEARAIGVPVLTHEVDMASARLAFADGSVAQLSCGRVSLEASRKLRFFTPERYLSVDCMSCEVKSVRRSGPVQGQSWPAIEMEPVEIEAGDALLAQDRDFVRCVREGDRPRVDGQAGVRALELVEAVKGAVTMPVVDAGANLR